MFKVTKLELFTNNRDGEPACLERTEQCPSGKITVRWEVYETDLMCPMVRVNTEGFYFTGRYFKRAKFYFDNGYVWDTLLKPEDEWRKYLYRELKKLIDSDYEELPGEHQSEMSKAARLLDDDMMYEI